MAAKIDVEKEFSSTDKKSTPTATKSVEEEKEATALLPNDLRIFSSFNYIFTMSCLTINELHNPHGTYRKGNVTHKILKSGGGVPSSSPRQREFFIDNLQIKSLVAPTIKTRLTNATSLQFEIFEPYSMGMFLERIQNTADDAGYRDYLEAPYLLEVEFVGWDTDGVEIDNSYTNKLRRMFPFKFVNIDFTVNESGSSYTVLAIPYNEQAFSSAVQNSKIDYTITGINVHESCLKGGKSISSVFNEREEQRKNNGEINFGNQYIITFPKEIATREEFSQYASNADVNPAASNASAQRGLSADRKKQVYLSVGGEEGKMPADFDADLSQFLGIVVRKSTIGESIRKHYENESNVNEIGLAKLIDNKELVKRRLFGRPGFVEKDGVFVRDNIQIDPSRMSISFPRGMSIQEMIEEIILLSDYGRKISEVKPDGNGMIPWFKIESHVFLVDNKEQERSSGELPKVYVYRVIPHMVHLNRFGHSTESSFGLAALEKQCVKEYNYIYSGLNDDVLEFNIYFDKAFFLALSSLKGSRQSTAKSNQEATADEVISRNSQVAERGQIENKNVNTTIKEDVVQSSSRKAGNNDEVETAIARDFSDALLNSTVDLIMADIKILGDPYFIADSGMGNYAADATPIINITADGTMDYQRSETDILVNFQTPVDYSEEGYITKFEKIRQFSGVYQVTECINNFSNGVFTQDLKLIRRRNQKGLDTVAPEVNKLAEDLAFDAEEIAKLRDMTPGGYNVKPDESLGSMVASSKERVQTQVQAEREPLDTEVSRLRNLSTSSFKRD